MELHGRILFIEAEGPSNDEMVTDYQKRMIPLRDQLIGKPWASVTTFRGQCLLSPSGKDAMIKGVALSRQMQLVACAAVVEEAEYSNITREFWESLYHASGVDYRFFKTAEEGVDWLKGRLEETPKL